MAAHQLQPPVLGVAWDGTGYGLDGTIWGGEFIHITADSWLRVAHFKPWLLPGGEKAVKEPRRVALGLLEVMENTDRHGDYCANLHQKLGEQPTNNF